MFQESGIESYSRFLFGSKNTEAVKRLLNSSENLDIAVAFWGEEIISTLKLSLKKNPQRKIRIICNLESGAVNPVFARFCLSSKQIQLKTNSRLHSKVIFSGKEYIVGSANISSNGLGHEGEELNGWMESSIAGYDLTILNDIQNWFLKEWKDASIITDTALKKYELLWGKKRNQRLLSTVSTDKSSLLDAVLKNPSSFKDKRIYLAIYRDHGSKEAHKKSREIEKQEGIKNLFFYENWEMPEDAYLINVYYGLNGKIMIEGKVHIQNDPLRATTEKDEDGETNELVFGKPVTHVEDYKKFCCDLKAFERVLPEIWKSIKDNGDKYGRWVRIDKVSKFFL